MLNVLLELIEPARLVYLLLGAAAFAWLAHHVVACGVAIVDGEFFEKKGAGLGVIFRGAPRFRHSTSQRIAIAIEHVLGHRIHFTLLSTGVASLFFSRYLADQWSGPLFWISFACVGSALFAEVLVVTFLACANSDVPRLWLSADCWPADSEEFREHLKKTERDARSWNRSRLRVFATIAALNLAGVLAATLLICLL